jgi:hypothetical protein
MVNDMNLKTLRSDLLKIVRDGDHEFKQLVAEIGIAHKTLRGFIDGTLKTHLQTAWKIEEWLLKANGKKALQ